MSNKQFIADLSSRQIEENPTTKRSFYQHYERCWEGIAPSAPNWFRGSGISAFVLSKFRKQLSYLLLIFRDHIHTYSMRSKTSEERKEEKWERFDPKHQTQQTYIHPYKYIPTHTQRDTYHTFWPWNGRFHLLWYLTSNAVKMLTFGKYRAVIG